jgi:ubiquinone/menaquinone biosynthesis C-methylase UbiE
LIWSDNTGFYKAPGRNSVSIGLDYGYQSVILKFSALSGLSEKITIPAWEPVLMADTHTHHHEWKVSAKGHFKRWSEHYDRDIINVLLFNPSYRRVLCQLRHWQRRGSKSLRILDIGCGTGTLLVHCSLLGSLVESATGLDMSEDMVAHAQAKARKMKLADRLHFTVGDAEHLPFPDNSFDLVTCCNSFHHYPHQDRALCEMRRVLDHQGRVMVIDGYRDDPMGYFIFDICVARVENHVHHCSARRFRDLLIRADFVSINQHVFGVCPPAIMNMAQAE